MIHLFIDTNIYLKFYGFNKEGIEAVKTIIDQITKSKIALYLPQQVKNEFKRNREGILKDIYKKIEALSVKRKEEHIPQILMNDDEFRNEANRIIGLQGAINKKREQIRVIAEKARGRFLQKVKKNSFSVDKRISELFSIAEVIHYTKKIVDKAITRLRLGNPPGKKGSCGDSVIWESLLEKVPKEANLYFVGLDSHFRSKINKNEFAPFLLEEWTRKKKSKIIPYETLGGFTQENIPEVKSSEKIKEREYEIDSEALRVALGNAAAVSTKLDSEVLREALGGIAPTSIKFGEVLREALGGAAAASTRFNSEAFRELLGGAAAISPIYNTKDLTKLFGGAANSSFATQKEVEKESKTDDSGSEEKKGERDENQSKKTKNENRPPNSNKQS